jgi:hypothetical protein
MESTKPATYRRDVCTRILDPLARGESVSIIGVGSSGKSNVARHIVRPDARAACLGSRAAGMHGALVDFTQFVSPSPAAFYKQLLGGLQAFVDGPHAPPGVVALRPVMEAALDKVLDSDSAERVQHQLKRMLAAVLNSGDVRQLFLVLDDFDQALKRTPTDAINSLRGLRDNHKNQLMYVVVSRLEIGQHVDETQIEDFAEIVTPVTIPVGLFAPEDAAFAADELIGRWNLSGRIDPTARQNIIQWSGGHPGLLKAILHVATQKTMLDFSARDTLDKLCGHRDTDPECQRIWDSLDESEHQTLIAAFSGGSADRRLAGRLVNKQLLQQRVNGAYIGFSPIFEHFVRRQMPETTPPVTTPVMFTSNAVAGIVTIDGVSLNNLDEFEIKLIERLFKKRNLLVPNRELIELVLPSNRFGGPPDSRLEHYLEGLAARLKPGGKVVLRVEVGGACLIV